MGLLHCPPELPDPKVNSYPVSDVYTVVTKSLPIEQAAPWIRPGRQWENATVNKVLA